MRRHAKQATAGSTKRLGKKSKPALLACALAACAAALALVVGSASGATTRFLVEVFGSSAQPSFPADRGMAYDQGASQLYVIDSTNDTIARFNANGTAANFGALGSNVIDGEGAGDETPLGHLAFESNRQREQIALDESGTATDGNIYATRSASDVVDVFASSGEYKGTLTESTATGAFGEPCGVAVDDEGTVYVGDRGDDRIHVFDPAGAVPVNADNTASYATVTDPCTIAAGMAATDGFLFVNASTGTQLRKVDAATGEVKYEIATGGSTVSVDPTTGHLFAARNTGSSSTVDEYDASGAAEASLVSSFKPGSTVEGIALNSGAEQVYVARSGTENVEVFGPAAVIPDVVTSPPSSSTGVRATLAGTVNPDGVELDECFFEWKQGTSGSIPFDQVTPCAQTPAAIGAGTSPVAVSAELDGLKPQGTTYQYRLVAKNPNATVNGSSQNFTTPDTVITQAATGLTPTEATLNGTVNPDGTAITECVFEWGPEKGPFEEAQLYPDAAPCVPGPGGIGVGTSPVAVSAMLSELDPGTRYAYRLKAANANGVILGKGQIAQTAGPRIVATWSEDVIRTEAIIKAEIDPEGEETTYHFEWGKTSAYGDEGPERVVGSDSAVHQVNLFLDQLEPGTKYHYRVIASNSSGISKAPDHTLTTFTPFVADSDCPNQALRIGSGARLPDCRAYEMVSPVDKGGKEAYWGKEGDTLTEPLPSENRSYNQSSLSGNKLTYNTYGSFGNALGAPPLANQQLSTRTSTGWATTHLAPPRVLETQLLQDPVVLRAASGYKGFSADLSEGYFWDPFDLDLTPDATSGGVNYYKADLSSGSLSLDKLVALTPNLEVSRPWSGRFAGFSQDGSHALFAINDALVSGAPDLGNINLNLYEWAEGTVRLVSILPSGEPSLAGAQAGGGPVELGADAGEYHHAISTDGARIFWKSDGENYVRIDGTHTKSAGPGEFRAATPDGSRALYVSPVSGEVRVFDVDSGTSTIIAANANLSRNLVGASENLEHVYVLSGEVLSPQAVQGARNLYHYHDGTYTFIATLATGPTDPVGAPGPAQRLSRVSLDGRVLVFNSTKSLTGHDNRYVKTGKPVSEVFRYDSTTDDLLCISCNPSGARPSGAREIDNDSSYEYVAASHLKMYEFAVNYRPRVVSDDGSRVFFESYDALLPHDTNGRADVYQWEARGVGTCTEEEGCLDLISTGTSARESRFLDASPSGDDVFIATDSSIDVDDPGLVDVYDARVGGGFAQRSAAPPCIGDSCQSVPAAPSDATLASASFLGSGDLAPRRNCGVAGRRAARFAHRAKRLRSNSRRVASAKANKRLRRRSKRFAKRAKRLSVSAKRCRRANRRVGR